MAIKFLNSVNADSGVLYIDADNNRVGIGTTNPSGKLHIQTDASSEFIFTGASTSGYTTTFHMDNTGLDIGHNSTGRSLNLKTGSLDRLTITGAGNVGIGTTGPDAHLEISANAGADPSPITNPVTLRLTDAGNAATGAGDTTNPWAKIEFYSEDTSSGGPAVQAQIATIYDDVYSAGSHISFSNTSTPTNGLSEKMKIFSNGNIRFNSYGAGILTTDADGDITAVSSVATSSTLDDVTDNGNSTTNSIVVGGVGSSGEIALYSTGTADATNTEYDSHVLRFSTSGWDTNNSIARPVHWNIRSEASSNVYPDAYLTFYEENISFNHWKLKLPGRGSGSSYIHPDAALFNGNVVIYESDTANQNIKLLPGGVSYFANSVGIGTTNANFPLHVEGGILAGTSASTTNLNQGVWVYSNSDGDYLYGMDLGHANSRWRTRISAPVSTGSTDRDISFAFGPNTGASAQSDYTEAMVIRGDSYNVGIGTTNPNDRLDVTDGNAKMVFGSASSDRPLLYFQHNAVPVDGEEIGLLDFRGYNDASQDTRYVILTAKAEDVTDGSEDGSLTFQTMAAGTATHTLTMRSGNVGIGTATPNAKLDVQGGDILAGGDIHIDNMGGYVTFYGNNSGMHSITSRDTAGDANDDIRINSYGNVLINLDSNNNNNNDAAFLIGRHGGANAAMQSTGLFVVREDGLIQANGTEIVYPLPYMYMGGSSITDEYLVLMKKNLGTAIDATGLVGKIVFQRGSTSNGNDLAEYEINMQSAYNNHVFWKFKRSGANVYERIDEITIDSVAYYALKARGNGGGPTLAHYFEGKILNGAGDSLLLTRVRESDANVTVVSTGVYYPDYQQISSNHMQGSLGIGTYTADKKLHVKDSGNEVAFFEGTGNSAWIDIKGNLSELWSIGATSIGYGIYNRTDSSYRFNIDNDGNVGIGTTSPSEKLTVNGNIDFPFSTSGSATIGIQESTTNPFATSAKHLIIQGANAFTGANPTQAQAGGNVYIKGGYAIANTGLGAYSGDVYIEGGENNSGTATGAGQIVIKTAGQDRMIVDRVGNVGIGTTSPTNAKVHIVGNSSYVGDFGYNTLTLEDGSGYPGLNFRQGDNNWLIRKRGNNQQLQFLFSSDASAAGVGSYAELVNINSDGNVGIGTTNPTYKLQVVGDSYIQASGGAQTLLLERTGGKPTIKAGTTENGHLILDSSTGHIYLNNYVNKSVFIATGGGNVGIGTTGPTYKLDVYGSARIGGSNGDVDLVIEADADNTGENDNPRILLKQDGGLVQGMVGLNGDANFQLTGFASNSMYIRNTGYPVHIAAGTTLGFTLNTDGTIQLPSYGAGFLQTDANGNVTAGAVTTSDTLDNVTDNGNSTTNSIILGDSTTNGTMLVRGSYASGNIVVIGGMKSSGGAMIGYAVKPDTANNHGFVSSSAYTLERAAYYQQGNRHRWYAGASQNAAIGNAVTISETMRLDFDKLGLSTSSPASLIHLGKPTNGANIITLGEAGIGGPHGLDFYGDDATRTLKYSIYYRTGPENISMETSDGIKRFEITQAGAVTFNEAFTFPTADGSAGAALVTNGSGSLSWGGGYQQYTPVGWGILNNQTYTSTGANISSNSTQAQSGTTPVQRNSATEFEATKAGWYEISYSFIVKNNYANRAMVGAYMSVSTSGGGGIISGSHSTQYVRYNTYGEYAQIQNTFYYYTSYSSTLFYLYAYLLSGSMNMTTQAIAQSMISFRYINNDIT